MCNESAINQSTILEDSLINGTYLDESVSLTQITPLKLSWGEGKHLKYDYEILASDIGLYWKSMRVGHLPGDAVSTGYENGAPLFSVRGKVSGKMSIGKYSSQHNTAYFPYNGKEHEVRHGDVEVLCFKV